MKQKISNLEWSPALLDNGARKTQKEWREWCANKKLNPKGWQLPTIEDYNELLSNQDKYKDVIEGIKKDLQQNWLMTRDVFIDIDGVAWPVARDDFDVRYDVGGYFNDGASRGVRKQKKHKETT